MTLTSENLKRIVSLNNHIITLDADGIFDLWTISDEGHLNFNGKLYLRLRSILPNQLFDLLAQNPKKNT